MESIYVSSISVSCPAPSSPISCQSRLLRASHHTAAAVGGPCPTCHAGMGPGSIPAWSVSQSQSFSQPRPIFSTPGNDQMGCSAAPVCRMCQIVHLPRSAAIARLPRSHLPNGGRFWGLDVTLLNFRPFFLLLPSGESTERMLHPSHIPSHGRRRVMHRSCEQRPPCVLATPPRSGADVHVSHVDCRCPRTG